MARILYFFVSIVEMDLSFWIFRDFGEGQIWCYVGVGLLRPRDREYGDEMRMYGHIRSGSMELIRAIIFQSSGIGSMASVVFLAVLYSIGSQPLRRTYSDIEVHSNSKDTKECCFNDNGEF